MDTVVELVEERTYTTWKNPTSAPVAFTLLQRGVRYVQDPTGGPTSAKRPVEAKVVIPPGGMVKIDSVYDRAIQYVRDGAIQSGLAPQLVRVQEGAEVRAPLHPSLATGPAPASSGATARDVTVPDREARLRARRAQ
jgi:hypothetical protein